MADVEKVERITTSWFFGQDGILHPAGRVVLIDKELLDAEVEVPVSGSKTRTEKKKVKGLATASEVETLLDTKVPGSGRVKTTRAAQTVADTTAPASQPALPIQQAVEEVLDAEDVTVEEGGTSRKASPLA